MVKFLVFIAVVLSFLTSQAAVHTDTHTYIVSEKEDKVLVIDQKSGEEKVIKVGNAPSGITIYGMFGYVVCAGCPDMYVIDLKTHKEINKIHVGTAARPMVIYKSSGCVVNFCSDKVYVIDLETQTLKDVILVLRCPEFLLVHGDKGYVGHWSLPRITVIDLETNKVSKIEVGGSYKTLSVHGDLGYLVHKDSHNFSLIDFKTGEVRQIPLPEKAWSLVIDRGFGYVLRDNIFVIDLKANEHIKSIDVGGPPQSIIIHGDYGYVLIHDSPSLAIIDLKTHTLSKSIMLDKYPSSFSIHEDYAYVRDVCENSIFVVDLKIGEVIGSIPNPSNLSVDFSGTELYLGVQPAKFGMRLFKYPYPGIEGFYLGQDPDEAFKRFEEAALKKEYKAAKEHFEIALSFGHKKACAVAFYAFYIGLWGAKEDAFWANEFRKVMDLGYFFQLDHEKVYPNNFKRTTLEVAPTP